MKKQKHLLKCGISNDCNIQLNNIAANTITEDTLICSIIYFYITVILCVCGDKINFFNKFSFIYYYYHLATKRCY